MHEQQTNIIVMIRYNFIENKIVKGMQS